MKCNWGRVTKTVAAFGAAMASLYVATEIQSDEIELSFTPGSVLPNSNSPQNLVIDELQLGFRQWNDSIYKTVVADSLTSVNMVKYGEVISPDDFSGSFKSTLSV